MKIALIGYGKMGRAVEAQALARGHQILSRIDLENQDLLQAEHLGKADIALEFSTPRTAFDHIVCCFQAGIPVVCGTTGWLERWDEINALCRDMDQTLVYSSNFSIGVQLFFVINRRLAALMAGQPQYDIRIEEIHHTQKKDAPSGTAITLAEQILQQVPRKKRWVNHPSDRPEELLILSLREDPAPGTHKVCYSSPIDDIGLVHTAHSREGFAQGAVLAAEWALGRKGIFGMEDVLGL